MASQYMSFYYDIDASRIPSQILAGIGFIGAGTIIRNGINVKGVTTAAGILSVTCIGIAVGMGYYAAAVMSTLLVFVILSVNHEVTGKFERFELLNISVVVDNNVNKTIEEIEEYFKNEKIVIQTIGKENSIINNKKVDIIKLHATYDTRKTNKNEVISTLVKMKSISKVIDDETAL